MRRNALLGRCFLLIPTFLMPLAAASGQTPELVLETEDAAVLVGAGLTPDGSRIVVGSTDHHVRIWNGKTGQLEHSLKLHEGSVPGIDISPDGRFVLSGGYDDSCYLTEIAGSRRVHSFAGHTADVNGASMSADGSRVITGSDDDTACIWDGRTGRKLHELAGHSDTIWNVAMSSDGSRAVTAGGDDIVCVWDVRSGALLHTLRGHTGGVNVVAISADGSRIASGAGDKLAKLWNGRTGELIADLRGHEDQIWAIAISQDGTQILTGGGSADKSVRLWEGMSGKQSRLYPDFGSAIFGLRFTSDRSRYIAASGDGTLRVYENASGKELVRLVGLKESSDWVAVTPDGNYTGSVEGIRRLIKWRVPGSVDLLPGDSPSALPAKPEVIASAVSPRGAGTAGAAPALPTEEGGHRWALLVGVNDYVAMRDLEFAVEDVNAVAERLLASGFAKDHVFILSDKAEDSRHKPTRANIERELKLVLGLAEPKDLVVVSFHGHGVHVEDKGFLCPNDGDLRSPETTMLPLDGEGGVYKQLTACRASLKVMLVDACRNDPRPPGRRSSDPESDSGALSRTFQRPPDGVLVLASCAQGQVSLEHGDLGHGVFTHFLLEGLAGKADTEAGDRNRRVSLLELFKYTNERTKVYAARKFSEFQTPELYGRVTGDFDLGSVFAN